MKSLRRIIIFVVPLLVLGFVVSMLYKWNYIQHQQRIPSEFNIPELNAGYDANKNKVDDAKDIFLGAMNYVANNPKYEILHEYKNGWPDGNYGSNGDVIAFALRNAGYDLQTLINQDIEKNPDLYTSENKGKNIAFRDVNNQRVFFEKYAQTHNNDYYDLNDWQAGDIIFFEKNHAAIVADKVNNNGIRFIIHHFWQYQAGYYQDVLETEAWGKIVGHYRVNQRMLSPKTETKGIRTNAG